MSNKSMMQFADTILSRSAFLREHYRDVTEFTNPKLPLPTLLLGNFGGVIASNWDAITPNDWAVLSAEIEQGLSSDDDDVRTGVATGLIEGLIHRAEWIDGLWPRIEARLGPLARSYADAYCEAT